MLIVGLAGYPALLTDRASDYRVLTLLLLQNHCVIVDTNLVELVSTREKREFFIWIAVLLADGQASPSSE